MEAVWIPHAIMDTPPAVNRRPRRHRKANRNAKYVAYVLAAIGITAIICYANYERVLKERAKVVRRSLLESQFFQDPRFRGLQVKIDTDTGLSVVSGVVATKSDMDALRYFLKWNRAPAGTRWRLSVEVLNAGQPRPTPAASATPGVDLGKSPP